MNENKIKELLKEQRNNCLKAYENYYAGSEEDFAPQCVCDDIANAEEPIFIYSNINKNETLIALLINNIDDLLPDLHPIKHSNVYQQLREIYSNN